MVHTQNIVEIKHNWHNTDQLYVIERRLNGKFHGLFESFHQNGQPWGIINYENGYINGKQKMYSNRGKLLVEAMVEDNYIFGEVMMRGKRFFIVSKSIRCSEIEVAKSLGLLKTKSIFTHNELISMSLEEKLKNTIKYGCKFL